ncbi:MAG TPA: 16S rRNA (cytidine(1402)-2'-O)-methyltransferase [Longimicrobiales bacterium]|nr:16S rRNA (cytidine(1402)-2'-O)-methyltransferase [Longimicrobiales bacterium]
MAGSLYVVATPIGNLEDLSPRAARVLAEVDLVLAEDTRRTRILMDRAGASTKLVSAHRHNEERRSGTVLQLLEQGRDVALVSDAGTPVVSDPGARLVAAAVAEGFTVVPIPGPSAVPAILSVSGLSADRFLFLGFPPRSGAARRATLARVAASEDPVVLFEAPFRIATLLDDLADACGRGRKAVVGRELTKLHEEVTHGTLAEVAAYYRTADARGEFVIVIEGGAPTDADDGLSERMASALAEALLERGEPVRSVAREVARRAGLPRNRAYELVQARAEARKEVT